MKIDQILILGIGNVLWADEGFGVRCIEEMNRQYEFPENVKLMDGGTQGIYLVPHVQLSDVLVIFDAIDYGLPSGQMKVTEDDDVPRFMGAKKMSLHQTGFQEVLMTSDLMGDLPEKMILIGVQPIEIEDFGGSLRPEIKKQMQPSIEKALSYLRDLGISYTQRKEPLPDTEILSPAEIALKDYEAGRPSAKLACRTGDDRVLNSKNMVFDPKASILEDSMGVDVDYRGQYDK